MSVTNETLTGFEAPSHRNLIRMIVVVTGLVAGAVFAVSLAMGTDTPTVDTPLVEAPAAEPSRSIQAQVDRLNGIAGHYGIHGLTAGQLAEARRWNDLAEYFGSDSLTRGQQAEAQRWAGIALRYGEEPPQSGSDEIEEKLWRRDKIANPYQAQDVLPDF